MKLKFSVRIRNNETGEIRSCPQDGFWPDGAEYWWLEGNGSCDCNRELIFNRVKGDPEKETVCGNTRFTVIDATLEDGKIIVLEGDESAEILDVLPVQGLLLIDESSPYPPKL